MDLEDASPGTFRTKTLAGERNSPGASIRVDSVQRPLSQAPKEIPMRTLVLYPYLQNGCWVFDDARTGLKEEAFVRGASEMITRLVEVNRLPAAARGFEMTFAAEPFPGRDVELTWVSRGEGDFGNDYEGVVAGLPMKCWLCPALELYFELAPRRISVKAAPLPAGVDPIWNPPPGVITRRFVEAPR